MAPKSAQSPRHGTLRRCRNNWRGAPLPILANFPREFGLSEEQLLLVDRLSREVAAVLSREKAAAPTPCADARAQQRIRRRQVHRHPLGLNELDVLIERERPAARGDNGGIEVPGRAKDIAFALAEVRLSLLREDLLDGRLLRRLDELVEIEERRIDARRKLPAEVVLPEPMKPTR